MKTKYNIKYNYITNKELTSNDLIDIFNEKLAKILINFEQEHNI